MIKAVIFDLDGLIVDTEILESRAFGKLLQDYGKKPTPNPDGLIHEIGGGAEYYLRFKLKYGLEAKEEELRAKKRMYFEKLVTNGELKPYDGFLDLIKTLKQHQYQLALASNRPIHHIRLILRELKVLDLFDVMIGPDEKRKHKPSPDTYLETAKQLRLKPEFCLALEDSAKGVTAAKAACIKVIAIPNEYTKAHDFSKADKIVNSLHSVTMELINSL